MSDMTMQTKAPIERMTMGTQNRALDWLIFLAEDKLDGEKLDLDQPYQRGLVWGEIRRRKLIQSFMQGVPVPSLIVNDRFSAKFIHPGYGQERNWATAVIDGKQRVSTIIGFVRDEFAVPASWFAADLVLATEDTDDGPYVRWTGLSQVAHRLLGNLPIAVSVGRFATLAEEREIFDRVNFGGVAQGESDVWE